LPICLPAYLPTCLPAYLPTYLPACLPANLVGWVAAAQAQSVKTDQYLRARGLGTTRASNPVFSFRKRYHRLYYMFKPAQHYWALVVIGRKFLIACASLLFRDTPVFLLSFCLLVLFVSYALQVCRADAVSCCMLVLVLLSLLLLLLLSLLLLVLLVLLALLVLLVLLLLVTVTA
jgi:hypothetical protein